jgi:hypothetical protein
MTQPMPCEHPESAVKFEDTQHRDYRGKLTYSRRIVTCQRCHAVISDVQKTYEVRDEVAAAVAERFAPAPLHDLPKPRMP